MHTQLPDPYPGRCLNVRHDTGPYGRARRCLEAEGTKHVCRFPDLERHEADKREAAFYAKTQPEQWKVPKA